MFDEFQLEKQGFELWKLKPPLTEFYKGGWMFVNKRDERYSLVKQIFTTTSSSIDMIDIGRALGYPLPYGEYTIQYMDDTESKEHGEIFATLFGLKPCTLLAHYEMPEYATGLVEKALKPMFDEFQLEKQGFELWKLKPPLAEFYKGGWMFVNKRHERYSLVKQIFTTTSSSINTVDIGRALGYPLPYGKYTIQYMDDTESKERNTCCVPMVEYTVGEGNFDTILRHFDQYAKLWQKIGRNLTIDLSEHPSMDKWFMDIKNGQKK
ncbi:unnamed protein product [Rotaria sordida]|uniref:Uncharacterized protein n=3 Tax=Rotaria sordida TaxID=392033 RepID=A0A814YY20_9BILA|nr:unnamed protein product [Rotaria sordida]